MQSEAANMETESRADAPPKGGRKVRLRTLADLDRRTKAAQATFALRDSLAADLGGWDRLSAMEREIVDSAAMLGAMLRDAGASYLSGSPTDLAEFQTLANCQRRLLETLGLKRVPKDVTPDLQSYLRSKASGQEAA